ncbi:hypothetical protein GCM10027612_24130 [Microbispora bryophytorum subsp. camponoti]
MRAGLDVLQRRPGLLCLLCLLCLLRLSVAGALRGNRGGSRGAGLPALPAEGRGLRGGRGGRVGGLRLVFMAVLLLVGVAVLRGRQLGVGRRRGALPVRGPLRLAVWLTLWLALRLALVVARGGVAELLLIGHLLVRRLLNRTGGGGVSRSTLRRLRLLRLLRCVRRLRVVRQRRSERLGRVGVLAPAEEVARRFPDGLERRCRAQREQRTEDGERDHRQSGDQVFEPVAERGQVAHEHAQHGDHAEDDAETERPGRAERHQAGPGVGVPALATSSTAPNASAVETGDTREYRLVAARTPNVLLDEEPISRCAMLTRTVVITAASIVHAAARGAGRYRP